MGTESGHLTRLLSNLSEADRVKLHDKIADDSVQLAGAATKKVGFYGTTPIVQPSVTAVGTTTATTALNETKIDRLYAALESIGIIVTA
ncbi:hypothetical protein LCGC14_2232770 [marine sediment metagenome]|uniref:Uncharacterized protein n=1 Tax=marine sediment metagenome TaxID=412755 RepID=A0A0F9D7H5_9ZZZZ